MKKEKKSLSQRFKESMFNDGEFYVKLCFTILFVVLFVVSFYSFQGYQYFYSNVYADELKENNFQIHVVNVKQGDCFLIKLPNNQCMIIDCGKEQYKEAVKEYISQFLYEENLKQIDYLVLTHPDSDHVGGAESVLKTFKVASLLRPPVYSLSEREYAISQEYPIDEGVEYDNAISVAYAKDIQTEIFYKGLKLSFGGCEVEFLSPQLKNTYTSNNLSAVMMFTYQTKKFLFMGDAEEQVEQELLLNYGENLKADVLKVGHHGSKTSTSLNFLNAVKPSYAIISSGNSSEYFPHLEVVERLEKMNTKILRTSVLNNFVIGLQKEQIVYVKAQRPANYSAIIFSFLLIFNLIVWEKPILKNNTAYSTKIVPK